MTIATNAGRQSRRAFNNCMKYTIDSRLVEPGDYFIPFKGPRFDGRDFIPDVIKNGGRVLDVDLGAFAKKYRKKLKCSVLAVTGSAGKTTTKDMLYAVLSQKYKVVKTEENQNNEVGVPLTILRADFSTEILILEMGMRGLGQISELARIARPSHVVITNIGLAHIELLGNQKKIALAKSEVFLKRLDWERPKRFAFLNASTAYYDTLVARSNRVGFDVLPFGGNDKPEQNINCCFSVGRHFGLSDDEIHDGLKTYRPSSHRMTPLELPHNVTVLDDTYNANPDGVIYSLQYLRRYSGRKILVLGDMLELGDWSESAHQSIVDVAIDAGVELLFTTGEHTQKITMASDLVWMAHFESKDTLVRQLIDEVKPGDVILVKGSRGMTMETVVNALVEGIR